MTTKGNINGSGNGNATATQRQREMAADRLDSRKDPPLKSKGGAPAKATAKCKRDASLRSG
jgi:hypothetical protein